MIQPLIPSQAPQTDFWNAPAQPTQNEQRGNGFLNSLDAARRADDAPELPNRSNSATARSTEVVDEPDVETADRETVDGDSTRRPDASDAGDDTDNAESPVAAQPEPKATEDKADGTITKDIDTREQATAVVRDPNLLFDAALLFAAASNRERTASGAKSQGLNAQNAQRTPGFGNLASDPSARESSSILAQARLALAQVTQQAALNEGLQIQAVVTKPITPTLLNIDQLSPAPESGATGSAPTSPTQAVAPVASEVDTTAAAALVVADAVVEVAQAAGVAVDEQAPDQRVSVDAARQSATTVVAAESGKSDGSASDRRDSGSGDGKSAERVLAAAPSAPSTEARFVVETGPETSVLGLKAEAPTDAVRLGATRASIDVSARSSEGAAPSVQAQVTRGLNAALTSRDGTVTIKLMPETLGSVRIGVTIEGGAIRAMIEVATPEAHDTVQRSLSQLRTALEARGIVVDRLGVAVAQSPETGSQQQQTLNHQGDRNPWGGAEDAHSDDSGRTNDHASEQRGRSSGAETALDDTNEALDDSGLEVAEAIDHVAGIAHRARLALDTIG